MSNTRYLSCMYARRLLFAQFVIVVVLSTFHSIALEHHLYWRFLWIDMPVHMLGGAWAGLFVFWLRLLLRLTSSIAWGVAGALVFGVAWEIFEVAAGLPRESSYALDTSLDLLMDALGGALAGFCAMYYWRRRAREM